MGAVDAWHKALADIEELKLKGTPFCGGVADIAKFFDQIRRKVVYALAAQAGMPANILAAYTSFLESQRPYNCLAGGVGTPHQRRCGIPQGCPFSMIVTAIILRPWVKIMRLIIHVDCFILADDVLNIANGERMIAHFAQALNSTRASLQAMGPGSLRTKAATSLAQKIQPPGSTTPYGLESTTTSKS